jgi:hypothetical protein
MTLIMQSEAGGVRLDAPAEPKAPLSEVEQPSLPVSQSFERATLT